MRYGGMCHGWLVAAVWHNPDLIGKWTWKAHNFDLSLEIMQWCLGLLDIHKHWSSKGLPTNHASICHNPSQFLSFQAFQGYLQHLERVEWWNPCFEFTSIITGHCLVLLYSSPAAVLLVIIVIVSNYLEEAFPTSGKYFPMHNAYNFWMPSPLTQLTIQDKVCLINVEHSFKLICRDFDLTLFTDFIKPQFKQIIFPLFKPTLGIVVLSILSSSPCGCCIFCLNIIALSSKR